MRDVAARIKGGGCIVAHARGLGNTGRRVPAAAAAEAADTPGGGDGDNDDGGDAFGALPCCV